jgi:NifU-like protein involved in Fe-S cluster formation
MIDDLYSAKILGLVANMPAIGRLRDPHGSAERVSKLCGSRITVDLAVVDGVVADFGQSVQACALGQAAAAILGANVIGADLAEIEAARDALLAMLKSGGPPPEGRFADLVVLQPVKDYPARHASTMLAFEAAAAAMREALARAPERTSRAGAA